MIIPDLSLEQREFAHDYLIPILFKQNGFGYDKKHKTYKECNCGDAINLQIERKAMDESSLPPEKIENPDEYTKIFNEEQIEVSKLKDEEVLQRIILLEGAIRQARTRIQADHFNLNERKNKMTKAQREALAEQDKLYRAKPEEPKAERKQPMSKDDKAIAEVMKLLKLDYEAAKKWIADNG